MTTIKDSGERTEFATGAQRDMHEGKGDMVSLPSREGKARFGYVEAER